MLKNIALLDVNVNKDIQELQEATPVFLTRMKDSVIEFIPNLIFSIVIFVIGWYLAKYLTKLAYSDKSAYPPLREEIDVSSYSS